MMRNSWREWSAHLAILMFYLARWHMMQRSDSFWWFWGPLLALSCLCLCKKRKLLLVSRCFPLRWTSPSDPYGLRRAIRCEESCMTHDPPKMFKLQTLMGKTYEDHIYGQTKPCHLSLNRQGPTPRAPALQRSKRGTKHLNTWSRNPQ